MNSSETVVGVDKIERGRRHGDEGCRCGRQRGRTTWPFQQPVLRPSRRFVVVVPVNDVVGEETPVVEEGERRERREREERERGKSE